MSTTRIFDGSRYAPVRLLGAGGMGQVWLVRHIELGAEYAAKVISPELAHDRRHVDRLRAEARALAKLNHQNLVRVFDFATAKNGRPYLVMELLRGQDLASLLKKRGKLPVPEAIDIIVQALNGASAAHAVQLVHRDLKPANIFVCDADRDDDERCVVKVVDFGVAKHDPDSEDAPAQRTGTGVVVGTPRFLSPEQCRGGRVDHRADLYALGLVLYLMLAGRGPFDEHKELVAMLTAHVKDAPPPPSTYNQAIPAIVDAVILRTLAKEPEDRYASAADLAKALTLAGRLYAANERERAPALARFQAVAVTETITEPVRRDLDATAPDPPPAVSQAPLATTAPAVPTRRSPARFTAPTEPFPRPSAADPPLAADPIPPLPPPPAEPMPPLSPASQQHQASRRPLIARAAIALLAVVLLSGLLILTQCCSP